MLSVVGLSIAWDYVRNVSTRYVSFAITSIFDCNSVRGKALASSLPVNSNITGSFTFPAMTANGWLVDKKTPDLYDWLGAATCLVGVSVMLWHQEAINARDARRPQPDETRLQYL